MSDTKVNLCDRCTRKQDFPECLPDDVEFGNGIGNVNIISCSNNVEEYFIFDAIKMLTENPQLKFKRVDRKYYIHAKKECGEHVILDDNDEVFTIVLEHKWILVEKLGREV